MKTKHFQGWCDEACRLFHILVRGFVMLQIAAGADVYTFESFAPDSLISGQDHWVAESGSGLAVVVLDASGNGTRVARHVATPVPQIAAMLTRVNDGSFDFLPFSGDESRAVIQFEATGEHVALLALGRDLDGDGILSAGTGETGPLFGLSDRNFFIQEANQGTIYQDNLNQGGGDGNGGNDWYRIQLRMDFTAAEGDGTGSLYFMNLTDGDKFYHTVSGMLNRPLGLKRLPWNAGPAHWNAMYLRLLSNGNSIPSVDNIIPNGTTLRWTQVSLQQNSLLLSWRGGTGPYQIQQSPDLSLGSWQNLGAPTLLTTATVDASLARMFFRIAQP
jgi:hypothetical protein